MLNQTRPTEDPVKSNYKKNMITPHQQGSLGGVTDLGLCVLSHQTIIFTGKMVFLSDVQHMLWSQKVYWKCTFQGSGDPNLLT